MNSKNKKLTHLIKSHFFYDIQKKISNGWCIVPLLLNLFHITHSMSDYPTYPTPAFYHVEKIGKELILDLNALTFNHELSEAWIRKSDYLFNQFLVLDRAINKLINNQEECRSYLLEDLHYLQEIISLVELAYSNITNENNLEAKYESMYTIIKESSSKLEALTELNQEIILY